MPEIRYQGQSWHIREDESLLLGLLRQGLELRNSCRNGVCNACMMKATVAAGETLEHGRLAPELVAKGYFLPCKTRVQDYLEIQTPVNADLTFTGMVAEKEELADGIVRIAIEAPYNPEYQPGQFIDIWHPSGVARPYSLASTPMMTWYLECHVRKIDGGLVSSWIVDELAVGDEVRISKPQGDVLVPAGVQEVAMLAFGVGMSSVSGLTLDLVERMGADEPALVRVRHVVSRAGDLYRDAVLQDLAISKSMLDYAGLVGSARDNDWLADVCRTLQAGDNGQRLYVLCGNDGAVTAARYCLMAAGVDSQRVLADAFTFQPHANSLLESAASGQGTQESELAEDERPYPATNPGLWAVLEEDNRLARILDSFYDRVFEDPIMSPYFHNSTKQRSKEKVFSFYKRLFSGEPCFFGDRPRNSHHWMVIPNEVYDHRLDLLIAAMREHDLPESWIPVWLEYEEYYRQDIVKTEPRGRRIGGVVQPVSGLDYEELLVGALCDSCQQVLEPGTRVLYHLRTGHIYCPQCEGRASQ